MQKSTELYADEQPIPATSIEDLDMERFEVYIQQVQRRTGISIDTIPTERLMRNLKLLVGGNCTLAGMLLFGKNTFKLSYQALIGAVSWYGNEMSSERYMDREDIKGNISELFRSGLLFIKRNLKKVQKGRNFNTSGVLEIPEVALGEALINALVHRRPI